MKSRLVLLILVAVIGVTVLPNAHAMVAYSFQVGAWGDNSSVGNRGVQAQIQTVIQPFGSPDIANAFWVGTNLQDGGFIQFGYEVTDGIFCNLGEQIVNVPSPTCNGFDQQFVASKPAWFYQYWPNVNVQTFYFGMGLDGSAGINGTWNTYTIQPAQNGTWLFNLNGQTVGGLTIPAVLSSSPAYMEAEKVSNSIATGVLGPVEFRNLQYYNGATWQYVNSLSVLRECGAGMLCGNIPFGVSAVGNNDILAGSNQPTLLNQAMLTSGGIAPSTQLSNSTNLQISNSTDPTLTILVPEGINVTVDGITSQSSYVPVSIGPHTISVNPSVTIGSTLDSTSVTLTFQGWVNQTGPNPLTINVTNNMTLEANYTYTWNTQP